MDLEQLRCFVVTAEELHFGRAAQKLGILPAALGRHIKLLEEELATRLIDRTTRSVTLTGDGAILLDRARALLADAADLESQFRARTKAIRYPSPWIYRQRGSRYGASAPSRFSDPAARRRDTVI